MGFLENGKWIESSNFANKSGKFVRGNTTFRDHVTATGKYKVESGKYHLYVSYACPWAHRTLIMRKLKGLEDVISISVVSPHMGQNGWEFNNEFPDTIADPINHSKYLYEVYVSAEKEYTGKVTVPVLWDKQTGKIVNNESREIMRMFDTQFQSLAQNKTSYYPENLQSEIDRVIDEIYEPINNGVYKAGFATVQEHYETAVNKLFDQLDYWENILQFQRFLCGNTLTEADICLFTTLFRFDPVYYVHFKCNIRRIVDYPNLWNYLKDIYQIPGISETCNLLHIKEHYYWSHPNVNPHRIVPVGPMINYNDPHDRNRFIL